MTWVVLDYQLDQDVEEVEIGFGQYEIKRGSTGECRLKLYNTDTEKVTEIAYKIIGGTIVERAAEWGEKHQASQDLPAKEEKKELESLRLANEKIRKQEQFIRDYRRKIAGLERDLGSIEKQARRAMEAAEKQLKENPQFVGPDKDLLVGSLEFYRNYLYHTDQRKSFVEAGRIYETLTGIPPLDPDENFDIDAVLEGLE